MNSNIYHLRNYDHKERDRSPFSVYDSLEIVTLYHTLSFFIMIYECDVRVPALSALHPHHRG